MRKPLDQSTMYGSSPLDQLKHIKKLSAKVEDLADDLNDSVLFTNFPGVGAQYEALQRVSERLSAIANKYEPHTEETGSLVRRKASDARDD